MRIHEVFVGSLTALAIACSSHVPLEAPRPEASHPAAPRMLAEDASSLPRFASESELRAYLERVRTLRRVESAHLERELKHVEESIVTGSAGSKAYAKVLSGIAFDATAAYAPNLALAQVSDVDSITHNQEWGVDEGDIVKRVGDHLIVLRRGRLHSIEIGKGRGDAFRLADVEDVFPYDFPHEAWYDEMLVDDRRIVVLGYSYETEATEIAIFDLDRRGRIRHRASHAIRSGDYYSWENYGSHLVDRRLVVYAPLDLADVDDAGRPPWPVRSTWDEDGLASSWAPLVESIEIVEPIQSGLPTTLHTVIECDLSVEPLECTARGIVGNDWSIHHMSATAMHLWLGGPLARFDPMEMDPNAYERWLQTNPDEVEEWTSAEDRDSGVVFRIPFDGSRIGAVEVEGRPFDQFAFRELAGALDLFLVRPSPASTEARLASWWRIPFERFARPPVGTSGIQVTALPDLNGDWRCRGEQRFVASHLLYGNCRRRPGGGREAGAQVIDLAGGRDPAFFATPGPVDRIEPVGKDALVVSHSDDEDDLGTHLLPIVLADTASPGAPVFRAGRIELEDRSHAFNVTSFDDRFLMGLPFARLDPKDPTGRIHERLGGSDESVSLIEYFDMDASGSLTYVGALEEDRRAPPPPDDCEVSCFDWYGAVRPIFIDDRVFGLIGDELVEARRDGSGLREVQRIRMRRHR